jgi:dihydroorotase-like cyclic amidohydrolase
MNTILLKNATIVNEGNTFVADVLIENERISKIASQISTDKAHKTIDLEGLHLLPGIIDDPQACLNRHGDQQAKPESDMRNHCSGNAPP